MNRSLTRIISTRVRGWLEPPLSREASGSQGNPRVNGSLAQLKVLPMKIYLKKSVWRQLTLIFALACFAFSPTALAVTPAEDGGYRNQNTAEDALFSLSPRIDNTAMGFDALDSNTTVTGNAPASLNWTATGSLNTAGAYHTATLLQNGMVLVAGGLAQSVFWRARNCTTRRAVLGLPQAASTPDVMYTRRRCYKTARSLLQGDVTTPAAML